jgi:hypothetical protein
LLALKAELHKRQKVATRTGNGSAIASEGPGEAAARAGRIGISVYRRKAI